MFSSKTKIAVDLRDPWKTVHHHYFGRTTCYGTSTITELTEVASQKGLLIDNWSSDLLTKVDSQLQMKKEVKLGLVSVRDLGFGSGASLGDVNKALYNNGAEKCFLETPLWLSLDYKDQPRGKWIWFYMNPIIATGGSPFVFKLARRGGGNQWLIGECGLKNAKMSPDSRIVYRISHF